MLITLVASLPASADVIRFKDGTRLRGAIVKRTPTEVIVQFDYGKASFAPADIIEVIPEEPKAEESEGELDETTAAVLEQIDRGLEDARRSAAARVPAAPQQEIVRTVSFAEAIQAVALVGVFTKGGDLGAGSGAVISPKGLIVTNEHVVGDAEYIGVLLPDSEGTISLEKSREHQARVLKTNACYDLALIRVPVRTPHYLSFAADQGIHVGEEVRAIGNPGGYLTGSVSKGVISSVRKARDMVGDQLLDALKQVTACQHLSGRVLGDFTMVQTDAAINPGNSGGPLLNSRNEIVGINSYLVGSGLGFAIHVKHVRQFVGAYKKE
jgi:S1-C subfamily serine protease